MTYYASTGQRSRLIAGLRGLAEFLESTPDAPAPQYADVHVFPSDGNNAQQRAEIDAIATRIGAEAQETIGGHYIAVRCFGPVQYRAVAIPRSNDQGPDGE
jgi:hypothetical protein